MHNYLFLITELHLSVCVLTGNDTAQHAELHNQLCMIVYNEFGFHSHQSRGSNVTRQHIPK